jgi:hypothetical protein
MAEHLFENKGYMLSNCMCLVAERIVDDQMQVRL